MFDFASIKKTLANYAGTLKKVRDEIEKLEQEREDVAFAPPSKADVKSAVANWVQSMADGYRRDLVTVLTATAGRKAADDPAVFQRAMEVTPLFYQPGIGEGMHGPVPVLSGLDRAMCGLFAPVILEAINRALDGSSWQDASPYSRPERAARIAEIDARLSELRSQEVSLVAAATEAGVNVEAVL
jgi:hypothetical protein